MKRSYSRDFTPKTEKRVSITIDRVPLAFKRSVMAKAKREGVAVRALVLGWLKDWLTK